MSRREMTFVYTRPGCVQCEATKRWLDDHGVVYAVLDAREHRDVLVAQGHMRLPVVQPPTGQPWDGHNPEKLAAHFGDAHVASPIAAILANHRAVVSGMPGMQTARGHCNRCGALLDFVDDPLCGDCQMGTAA